MRALLITLASAILTSCIVANAFYQKKQFYPSVIFITRSNSSMLIIYLQAFICVLLVGKLFRFIFFGELRATETENLIERSWHAISETCLAFTVFRDDLNPKFVALFTLLLFLKCFHWLAEDRVDFMERSPNISLLFHVRITSLLIILGLLDVMFITFAYHSTMLKGASVQLVFGFEYAILLAIIITIIIKYSLHRYDLEQREIPWENKGVYLLYFELLVGFYKVVLYLSFIIVMARIHSFPLFAVRPMYLSAKAFQKALNDVILSRRAIRNMNTLYPNATQEELASVDNVCIICREEMIGNGTAKKLPCNHIFHVSCLRSWFQRQQTCPTCRMNILDQPTNLTNQQQQQNQQVQQNQQQQNQAGNNQANNQAPNQSNQAPNRPQQQQPNQINTNFRLLLGNFNLPDNLADLLAQDHRQQQARSSTQTAANNQTDNRANQSSSGAAAFITPPFLGFPFMPPFLPFPPLSSSSTNSNNSNQTNLNLGQLNEEELRRLEGNEREALEARIRLLQNLRTSIDAFVLQFQQYNELIVRTSNDQRRQQQEQQQQTSGPSRATTSSNEQTDTKKEDTKKDKSTKFSENKNETKATTSGASTKEIIKENSKAESTDNTIDKNDSNKENNKAVDVNLDEESRLRELRLRRFKNQCADETFVKTDDSKKD